MDSGRGGRPGRALPPVRAPALRIPFPPPLPSAPSPALRGSSRARSAGASWRAATLPPPPPPAAASACCRARSAARSSPPAVCTACSASSRSSPALPSRFSHLRGTQQRRHCTQGGEGGREGAPIDEGESLGSLVSAAERGLSTEDQFVSCPPHPQHRTLHAAPTAESARALGRGGAGEGFVPRSWRGVPGEGSAESSTCVSASGSPPHTATAEREARGAEGSGAGWDLVVGADARLLIGSRLPPLHLLQPRPAPQSQLQAAARDGRRMEVRRET
jgi:hypothetical protein